MGSAIRGASNGVEADMMLIHPKKEKKEMTSHQRFRWEAEKVECKVHSFLLTSSGFYGIIGETCLIQIA